MSARPTVADIAKEIGVSPSTVSRALRDHPAISEARKVEVRATAEAMGFDVPALEPAQGDQPRLVSFVVPSISHPFFGQVIEKLEAVCSQNSCEMIVHNSGGSPITERAIVDSMVSRRPDGVFFVPSSIDSSAVEECVRQLKTVVITQKSALCPSIGVNHAEGGRQVAEHFKELGRRSALLVGPTDDDKLQGFRDYIEGQQLTGFRVDTLDVANWDEGLSRRTYEAMTSHFNKTSIQAYDCLFGFNDLAAFGAMHALRDFGRNVPVQIAVSGFDDTPLCREMSPGLTSVAQPIGQIVRSGFLLLQQLMRGESVPESERNFSLKPHLVVRGSTFEGN